MMLTSSVNPHALFLRACAVFASVYASCVSDMLPHVTHDFLRADPSATHLLNAQTVVPLFPSPLFSYFIYDVSDVVCSFVYAYVLPLINLTPLFFEAIGENKEEIVV